MSGRIALLAVVVLTGCATPPPCPPPEVVEIVRTERVPVPSWLTADCAVSCGEIETNGNLMECLQDTRRALAECNARMSEIRGLR